jgi:hypothetical protein
MLNKIANYGGIVVGNLQLPQPNAFPLQQEELVQAVETKKAPKGAFF